jgi:hypothetical protein
MIQNYSLIFLTKASELASSLKTLPIVGCIWKETIYCSIIMIEKYNKYIPLKTAKKNDLIKLLLYLSEAIIMTISDIAKSYRVRPQVVYMIVRDFESMGSLKIDRAGRSLILNEKAIETIKRELERRGYEARS